MLSVFMVLVIISISIAQVFATEIKINENKIDLQLQSILVEAENEDKVKVAVWLKDIDDDVKESAYRKKFQQERNAGNISQMLFSMTSGDQNFDKLTLNDIQLLSEIKLSAYKEIHFDRNYRWVDNICKNMKQINIIHKSSYAPVVILETTKSNLNELAQLREVECIFPWDDKKLPTEEVNISKSYTTSSETIDYGVWQQNTQINTMHQIYGLDGEGIKIGMLENGLPDTEHTSGLFNNSNIVSVNNGGIDSHATYIAAILVGATSDYNGVVPSASLFCAGYESGYIIPIEKLLNKNINILTISLELGGASGVFNTYGYYSKYLDYIVYNYNISVCMCAGNKSGNPGVPEGAMGYNIITVGNIDDFNTPYFTDDCIRSASSYNMDNQSAYKPDICAPGARVGTPDSPDFVNTGYGGTSAATPIVSGICAMLMQADATLVVKPMLIKSILMSSARRIPNMDSPLSDGNTIEPALSRRYGSGLVNASNALSMLLNNKWEYIPLVSSDQNQNPYTINVTVSQNAVNSSKKLAVSLNWTQKVLSDSYGNSIVSPVFHHTLSVYDPNGNLVAFSNYQYDRKQFVYFQPSVPGVYQNKTYKIDQYQPGVNVLTAISYNLR